MPQRIQENIAPLMNSLLWKYKCSYFFTNSIQFPAGAKDGFLTNEYLHNTWAPTMKTLTTDCDRCQGNLKHCWNPRSICYQTQKQKHRGGIKIWYQPIANVYFKLKLHSIFYSKPNFYKKTFGAFIILQFQFKNIINSQSTECAKA